MNFSSFEDLAARVTEAIVGDSEYLLATIGLADQGPGKPIRMAAGAGQAIGYLQGLSYSWDEALPEGQGPAGRAVRAGAPFVMRDALEDSGFKPWLAKALSYGIRSSATVPFEHSGTVLGVIKVYSGERDAFGPRELEVFSKLGHELAFALSVEESRRRLREAEEAVTATRAELARAARLMAIGEFASNIAHEVNQPVSAIMTNAGAALRWLDKDKPDLDEVRIALQRIVRDAGRTSAVIGRTRAQLTKGHVVTEPLDINQVLHEALLVTQTERGRESVSVETQFDEGLPAVPADRVQMQQVAVNLIVNAMDAMREVTSRRRVLCITTRRSGDSGDVEVSVADTGHGLGGDRQHRVFEHFFTTKSEGLGLGLPISRSIIEGIGGRLSARPNSPHGAVFTFTLPTGGSA